MTGVNVLVLKLMVETKLAQPNPSYTWLEMKRLLEMDLDLLGRCFVWSVPNSYGQVVEAWRIHPSQVMLVNPTPGFPAGRYQITGMLSSTIDVPPEQMIRLFPMEVSIAARPKNRGTHA